MLTETSKKELVKRKKQFKKQALLSHSHLALAPRGNG
jgi:hypothetical protein